MRVDLENFDFEIEFVPGKSNVVTDALSRIKVTPNEFKSMSILQVQTRSMLSKPSLVNNNTQSRLPEPDQLRVYDAVNNEQIYKLRKLQFSLRQHNNDPIMSITICERNFKASLTLASSIPINIRELPNILQLIEKGILHYITSNKIESKSVAISTSDAIFNYMSINDFKAIRNQILKHISIIIYNPAKVVSDQDEIQSVLQHHHNTVIEVHIGINRL